MIFEHQRYKKDDEENEAKIAIRNVGISKVVLFSAAVAS